MYVAFLGNAPRNAASVRQPCTWASELAVRGPLAQSASRTNSPAVHLLELVHGALVDVDPSAVELHFPHEYIAMAALYLHQALFSESSVPQTATSSSTRSSLAQDRRLSAVSSVTLHGTASDHSHPTEPLLDSEASSAYLELLARQPRHPTSLGSPEEAALRLEGDPVTAAERRSHCEHRTRSRLRRLRWAKCSLLCVIGEQHPFYSPGSFTVPQRPEASSRALIECASSIEDAIACFPRKGGLHGLCPMVLRREPAARENML